LFLNPSNLISEANKFFFFQKKWKGDFCLSVLFYTFFSFFLFLSCFLCRGRGSEESAASRDFFLSCSRSSPSSPLPQNDEKCRRLNARGAREMGDEITTLSFFPVSCSPSLFFSKRSTQLHTETRARRPVFPPCWIWSDCRRARGEHGCYQFYHQHHHRYYYHQLLVQRPLLSQEQCILVYLCRWCESCVLFSHLWSCLVTSHHVSSHPIHWPAFNIEVLSYISYTEMVAFTLRDDTPSSHERITGRGGERRVGEEVGR
jgi:hypothetical protein